MVIKPTDDKIKAVSGVSFTPDVITVTGPLFSALHRRIEGGSVLGGYIRGVMFYLHPSHTRLSTFSPSKTARVYSVANRFHRSLQAALCSPHFCGLLETMLVLIQFDDDYDPTDDDETSHDVAHNSSISLRNGAMLCVI